MESNINNKFEKVFKVFTWINIFLLSTVGLCTGAIGLIGMGTGDEGGIAAARPGVLFPIIYLATIIASLFIHKNNGNFFSFLIYIIPILYFMYLLTVPGFFIPY